MYTPALINSSVGAVSKRVPQSALLGQLTICQQAQRNNMHDPIRLSTSAATNKSCFK